MIRTEDIKTLREKTGASISEVRNALITADGDIARALQILERSLGERGSLKAERETRQGIVDCYIHSDKKIGVLVEILCETDFVARTSEFKALVHDVAMHIAAMNPLYVRKEDVPREVMEAERGLVDDLDKHFSEVLLLTQPFVKNPDKTVGEVLNEAAGKFGENIRVGRFVRFAI